jgi:hypothetical protein
MLNSFALALMLATGSAGATLYKWTDANGNVQYGEFPPAGSKAERLKAAPAPASTTPGKSLQQQVEEMEKRQETEKQHKAGTETAGRRKPEDQLRECPLEHPATQLWRQPAGTHARWQLPASG